MSGRISKSDIRLIPNNKIWWEQIRQLRNNPKVQGGFLCSSYISVDDQWEYMKKYNDCYYVATYLGNFCGYIGVVENDIRICTHPDFEGKGVGKFMLSKIKIKHPNAKGRIKKDNLPSQKVFNSVEVPYEVL